MFGSLFVWWFALGVTIRPYVPPVLGPEPELLPSSLRVVERYSRAARRTSGAFFPRGPKGGAATKGADKPTVEP